MLRRASLELASRSVALTSVARTTRSLAAVDKLLSASGATHYMLALDWTQPGEFLRLIHQHLSQTRKPDLVVAWLHDEELAIRFAVDLDASEPLCRFFHVVGSATADPYLLAAKSRDRLSRSKVAYHQVILGYVAEGGTARWLTNDEISAGAIDAIARSEPEHVVGTVRPWSIRPKSE